MSETPGISPLSADDQEPLRVVLAKLGFDGHDRGLKVVARTLRDAGMEVIYLGLRQTTDSIVAACEQEDADVIGLSMHNAGHLTLAPRMVQAVEEAGLGVPVVIGAGGVERIVEINLNASEKKAFDASVGAVRGLVNVVKRMNKAAKK